MHALLHMLAAGNPAATGIAIVVALIFWAISAMGKMAKNEKEKQQDRRQEVRDAIEMSRQQVSRELSPEIARRIPPPVRPMTKSPPRKRPPPGIRPAKNYNPFKTTAKRPAKAAPPPLPLVPVEVEQAPLIPTPIVKTSAPTATGHGRVSVDAAVLGRWLKPVTLRQQFIITELLQPPISLREDPGAHLGIQL